MLSCRVFAKRGELLVPDVDEVLPFAWLLQYFHIAVWQATIGYSGHKTPDLLPEGPRLLVGRQLPRRHDGRGGRYYLRHRSITVLTGEFSRR